MNNSISINLKLKIVILLVIALIISFFIYSFIIKFYVDPYLENYSDLNRGVMLLKFYNYEIGSDKIYYLGSSSVKEDIDATLIDEMDKSFGNYNLGNPATTPLRELIELESIINSKPKVVVIGLDYMSLSGNWLFPYDQYALISPYINLKDNPELTLFYNETYTNLLKMNKLELLIYKRKFVYPATSNMINLLRYYLIGSKKPYSYNKYNKDFKSGGILLQSNESYDQKFIKELQEKVDFSEYNTPHEENIEKRSFEFIVKKLLQNKIKVIILKMPLNPNLFEKIPNEYKNNFNIFLNNISNEYNVLVLDYTSEYDESYFYDGHHLNKKGKEIFSRGLGENIIKIIKE